MQGPNHEVPRFPAFKRKRVSAHPEIVNKKLAYLTPMPLHSTGTAIAGLVKGKGIVSKCCHGITDYIHYYHFLVVCRRK